MDGLVGRERELGLIRSLLDRPGAALSFGGEPGVGKSVLLDSAANAAAARGFRVLRAAGAEFEADVGYSGLHQLLLGGSFDRLAPAHRDALREALSFGAADRIAVSTAVLSLLRQADRPLLVVVDNLQWLDRPSAAVLSFAGRRLGGSQAVLLAASRNGTDNLFDPAHELPPLDAAAATDLLRSHYPDLADAVQRKILEEAQGNPLALRELPAALSRQQLMAEQALPDVLPLNRKLQALFAGRVAELPTPARDLLLLAALDGTGDLDVLQAVSDLSDLAAAERAGLVTVGGRLAFKHPLVRPTVVHFATHAERRRGHRALAEALGRWPDRRAWHLAHATAGADEHVAALMEQASQRALRRGDAAGGVAALLRAADLSPRGADRSRRLVDAAYAGAEIAGGLHDVPRLLADAERADPQPCGSSRAAVATVCQLLNGEGDVDTAHRLLATGAVDDEVLFTLLLVCFLGGRPEMWEPFDAAMARPRSTLLSLAANLFADPARASPALLAQLDDLITKLPREADPVRIVWIGRCAVFVDRVPACREALTRVIRDGHHGGAVASAIAAAATLCVGQVGTGEWDAALHLAADSLKLCAAHGYRMMEWPFWYAQATIAALRGDTRTALALTDRMLAWASSRRSETVRVYAFHVRALAALSGGDAEEAYSSAARVSQPGVLARHVPLALWAATDLVEAAVRTRRHAEAIAHVRAMRDTGLAALSSRMALTVTACAAIVAGDGRLFDEALSLPGMERWPFDLARVRLAYGERLRRTHAASAARAELNAALDIFERLGARPWADRARHELCAAGQNRTATGHGHAALTAQEREIAHLAATGLTNKQVGQRLHLSHRTIGAHLYRIFPKLGIKSRAALRDALDSQVSGEDRGRTPA